MELATHTTGRILLVGCGPAATDLAATLRGSTWRYALVNDPKGVLQRLRREANIDVVLLAPDGDLAPYTELCRQIKFDARTQFVCVIFALRTTAPTARAEVFAAGVDDCIQVPAAPGEVLLRLTNAYRVKRVTDSLEDATAVISSLANAIEGRDQYTRGHVDRVATYALEIGQRIGVTGDELATLRIGAVVHDIGKVAVPDHILNKPGRLTDEEFAIVKRHPVVGYDILQPLRTFRRALPIVRWHHERPNGTGYPDGLAGDALPLLPRIVAVADVFDALSTNRAYRAAMPPEKYRPILVDCAARGDLDPELVGVLFEILDQSLALLAGAPATG